MTTYIEILDTAVKIGLGAAISGAATYVVTRMKSDRDVHQEVARHKRELLERISLGVQNCTAAISRQMHYITQYQSADENARVQLLTEAMSLSLKVNEQLNTAKGLAWLLGESDLTNELQAYADKAVELHYLVRDRPQAVNSMDKICDGLNELEPSVADAIHAAYERAAS
jgi:pyruvate-formate lyase